MARLIVFLKCEMLYFPGTQPIGSEVQAGQKAIVTCLFTGLTQKLDSITWLKSDGTPVSYLVNFEEEAGDYNDGTDSQTSTLTVPGTDNVEDSVYICQFTSTEWAIVDDRSVRAPINIFGGSQLNLTIIRIARKFTNNIPDKKGSKFIII